MFFLYALTGLHELKYRKVIHTGDTTFGGAASFTAGLLISVGVVLWALSGLIGFNIFKERLFYAGISVIAAWLAFYFYALEFGVMYMKGASERGQRYLIRLVFLLPFITMFIVALLGKSGDIYRLSAQLLLIWLCVLLCRRVTAAGQQPAGISDLSGAALRRDDRGVYCNNCIK